MKKVIVSNKVNQKSLASSMGCRTYNGYDINFNFKCAIIFGNEANGISREILCKAEEKIKIRMKKNIESLNISVAAGILLNKIFIDRSDFFGL